MNAHRFIGLFGIGKATRVINNVVNNAEHYSESTGSYYSHKMPNSVKISDLKNALRERLALIEAKDAYETKLKNWNMSESKEE
ncbi:hypothetical protein J9896_08660 [Acinetobacter baumannii]|uniref:hypothetical protein n=1 Tax=Acinetobacter baumannii TaxID=470 RepID=UPI001B32CA2A|nr:hypothetical protein [Acinetobacter baumannii]MBP4063470.1 hypothetical protein [Acinetobacter baumannii]